MWTPELEKKIAQHELHGDKIVNYVLKYFFWGYEGITVDKISIVVAKRKLQNLDDVNEEVEGTFMLPDDIETGATAITTGSYQELDRMIEEYRQEGIEIEKLKHRPDFIQKLIDAELLQSDGKTATGKLDDIAEFLVDKCGKSISRRFLKITFLQKDGTEWSPGAVAKAVGYGRVGLKSYKKNKKEIKKE
jgi:hypothetical protein